jgi:hypothetical protein
MSFDPEDSTEADASQDFQETSANITAALNGLHRKANKDFGSALSGSYVRTQGSSVFMHQNGGAMLSFASNELLSPSSYQVPNERLVQKIPKFNQWREGGEASSSSPKLPRREESKVLSCSELANIFDDDDDDYKNHSYRIVSAIEEDEGELEQDDELPASKLISMVETSIRPV